MALTRSTVDQLVSRVGDKLDIDPSTGIPNDVQIKQWLQDACIRIAESLPTEMLGHMLATASLSNVADPNDDLYNLSTVQSQRLRYVNYELVVGTTIKHCTYLPLHEFLVAVSRTPQLYGTSLPLVTISHLTSPNAAVLKVYPNPNQASTMNVQFVHMPAAIASWDTPGELYVPLANWEEAMVDYAVICAKVQDEEVQQVQLLMQHWQQNVAMKIGGRMTFSLEPSRSKRQKRQQQPPQQ